MLALLATISFILCANSLNINSFKPIKVVVSYALVTSYYSQNVRIIYYALFRIGRSDIMTHLTNKSQSKVTLSNVKHTIFDKN